MPKSKEWLRTHIRQVHMDFHMPEFPVDAIRRFNAEEFVGHLVRGKVNMVALFAKCHFGNSFYNTRVGHKHEGLPNDFLREAAEECRRHDIKTIAYYSFLCDVHAHEERPHWRRINANGESDPRRGCWGRLCPNTPYREELALPQLEEIAADYPVDGFFIDIPFCGPCWCPYCKEKFRLMYGRELDASTPVDEVTAFMQNSTGRFLRELRVICDRHNPDLKIVTNCAWKLDSSRYFSEGSDYGVWESQPHQNYLSHSFAARSVRTLDVPVQVMSVRFFQGWGDLTLKPTAQMTTEFAAMIGNGAVASSGDQVNVDGTLQPPVYDMFNQAFGFVEAREKILLDAESVTDTALLAPVARRDCPAPEAVGPAMKGAHKALVESHVQFDILNSLDIDKIDRYRTIILTEPNDFAPGVFEALEAWVRKGGTLIAVGGALVSGGDFAMQDAFGLEFIEPSVFSVSHFRPTAELPGDMVDLPLQLRGRAFKVVARGATTLAEYIYPQIEQTHEHAFRHPACPPPADRPSPYAFATENKHGKGRCVYVAGSVFRVYWETNHHWLRQFVEALLRRLDPNPLYRVDAPSLVETNLMKTSGGDLLLNLIHYQVGHQGDTKAIPSIEKVYPLGPIPCSVKAKGVQRVALEPMDQEIAFKESDGYVSFTIPSVEYMSIARIVTGRKKSARK